MNATYIKMIIIGIIAVALTFTIARKLIRLGFNILMSILIIVFMAFAAPKINKFLLNRFGENGIIENKLSEIVDGDIESRVKYDYKLKTGQDVTDEALLEQLKAEAYHVDESLSDEMNILLNMGLPESINKTLLLNFGNIGSSTIQASTFAHFVAKFFILRITTLISYLIAFCIAVKMFSREYDSDRVYKKAKAYA